MPRDGSATKLAIMEAAEAQFLEQGYAGASIENIIDTVGITKGAFFYHFKSKHILALALVNRFAELDLGHLNEKMQRAENLSRDPLQQLLIFIGLFKEEFGQMTEPHPGCLFASVLQEAGMFQKEAIDIVNACLCEWRTQLTAKLKQVAELYPPRREVDLEDLADLLWVIFEGAFLLSKTLENAQSVSRQLEHYRLYLELLFEPAS